MESTRHAPAIVLGLAVVMLVAGVSAAQDAPAQDTAARDRSPGSSTAGFLAGAALAFGAHEGAHVAFDLLFDARPGLGAVRFAGVPFFAITHRADLSPRREFTISSAGFWAQHATSEWLLTARPGLRAGRAPLAKGVVAFNLMTSVAYASAAFGRGGPAERDTRSMAVSRDIDERWVGAMVLGPALLDGYRYYHPEARWAVWVSRAMKVGLVVLVVK